MAKMPLSNKSSFSFPKSERLTGKKEIAELFEKGSAFYLKPLKVLIEVGSQTSFQFPKVLIAVPKSKINSAVKRNLIKRRIRESYRLNKPLLQELSTTQGINFEKIGFVYLSDQVNSFDLINASWERLIKKAGYEISRTSS